MTESTTSKQKNNLPEQICKVALIGAGYMAEEHLKAFCSISHVQVAGIFSRTFSRAEQIARKYSIANICRSIDELYDKSSASLIVVTVPELSMNDVSKQCFAYPWTVLMEKPAGYNLQDAEDICSAAVEKHAKAFVAFNRRFYSSTRTVLEDLAQRPEQRFIHVQDQEDPSAALKNGQPRTVVDHWMYANSVHIVDYLRTFGRGKITAVTPICPWSDCVPLTVAAKVDFESGDTGLYQGVWGAPGPWAVQVTTYPKRWELRPLEQAFFQPYGERKLHSMPVHPFDTDFKPGLRLQAEHAVAAAGGQPSELVPLSDSLETMRLIHAIFGK